jgi:hypothetical protein
MTTARKTRGELAEIPRKVKFLAIIRKFRGDGNRNSAPACTEGYQIERNRVFTPEKWVRFYCGSEAEIDEACRRFRP